MENGNEFDNRVSRRNFFTLIGWGGFCGLLAAGGAAFARFFYPNVLYEPRSTFNAGNPLDYAAPTGSELVAVDERFKESQGIWIVRNRKGIYAMVGVCTHLGCTPNWFAGESRFKCACHGTNFNVEGEVESGPAPEPLYRAKITIAPDGSMIVTTGLLGIQRASLQSEKKVPGAFWTKEERVYLDKPPYFLPLA